MTLGVGLFCDGCSPIQNTVATTFRFHSALLRKLSRGSSTTTRAAVGTPKGSLSDGSAARRSSRNRSWASASRSVNWAPAAWPRRAALAIPTIVGEIFTFWGGQSRFFTSSTTCRIKLKFGLTREKFHLSRKSDFFRLGLSTRHQVVMEYS